MRVTFEEFSPTHDFFDYRGVNECPILAILAGLGLV